MISAAALLLVLQLSSAAAQAGGAGPPASCPTSCGNVTVPYPFGIGAGCYLPGFDLTCDRTRHPPRLLFSGGSGTLEVAEISLTNSTVRAIDVAGAVNISNYNQVNEGNGTWRGLGTGSGSPYVVSQRRNQFVVTGCNVQGTLLGDSDNIITGCSSFCSINDGWTGAVVSAPGDAAACSGISCCETPIPLGRPSYTVKFRFLDVEYAEKLPNAVRIAERGWFDSVAALMLNKSEEDSALRTPVPVVLEWVVASTPIPPAGNAAGNSSCPVDAARSACRSSHSTCHNVTNNYRTGYVCRCQDGYEGNPYLAGDGGWCNPYLDRLSAIYQLFVRLLMAACFLIILLVEFDYMIC